FSWKRIAARTGALLALLATTFWVFGYIGSSVYSRGGNWGRYGADLTTFFSSMGFSRYLPDLPLDPQGSYEGFPYLGGGPLLLTLAALVMVSPRHVGPRIWRTLVPLGLACVALAMFAASAPIRFGGQTFADPKWLHGDYEKLADIFRAAGRFIWPL